MLYEVITATKDLEILALRSQLSILQQEITNHRITSYNVCYTKLLRVQDAGGKRGQERVRTCDAARQR